MVCCKLSNESARWKTSPWNERSKFAEADAGVDGMVAWAAGPRAADSGVAGMLWRKGDAEEAEEMEDPPARWRWLPFVDGV